LWLTLTRVQTLLHGRDIKKVLKVE
jgi:hypothetical protein